ncbi:MAG: hypothetical protein ACKPGI_11080 [Verrucomicrobiota bacterium]
MLSPSDSTRTRRGKIHTLLSASAFKPYLNSLVASPQNDHLVLRLLARAVAEEPTADKLAHHPELKEFLPLIREKRGEVRRSELMGYAALYRAAGLGSEARELAAMARTAIDSHLVKAKAYETWHNPLSRGAITLGEALRSLKGLQGALQQDAVPLIIQLVENPRFKMRWDPFPGRTSMDVHDCIHIVLGRGLQPIDEAFVLGFTMGCTDRFSSLQQRAFLSVVRRFYPQDYRFTPEQEKVFQDAAALGFISDCRPLADVDFEVFMDKPLNEVRKDLGVEEYLLRAYFQKERDRLPNDPAAQRLLD